MLKSFYTLLRDTAFAYIADEALTRGAAIAFYTVTSLGPVLVIVVAIAGLAFGQQAAQGAIVTQLSGLMGSQSASLLQSALQSASGLRSGLLAGAIGFIALLVTASGVFVEMQTALNVIWGVPEPQTDPVTRIVRARALSLGLVGALGFLLLVSLLISAGLAALASAINQAVPFGAVLLRVLNVIISFALITVMFGAIYKVLPDRNISWRDVIHGAVTATALFTVGKYLIGLEPV
jgi:membrane protein